MKKRRYFLTDFVRIFLMALLCFFLLAGCKPTPDDPPDDSDDPDPAQNGSVTPRDQTLLYLGENGRFSYRIVTTPAVQYDASMRILSLISEWKRNGFSGAQRADEAAAESTETEIVVGTGSTRAGCYIDAHTLGRDGWRVSVVGDRILIVGGSDAATARALDAFAQALVYSEGRDMITLPRNYTASYVPTYPLSDIRAGGVSLRDCTILTNMQDQEIYFSAIDFQNKVYTLTGIWIPMQALTEPADHPIYFRNTPDAGDTGFRAVITEEYMAVESAYSNMFRACYDKFAQNFFAGADVISHSVGYLHTERANVLYYSDFGAVGDGIANDYRAICQTHEVANRGGQPVRADAGKTYYIGPQDGNVACIRTNVDWGDAVFIVDDSVIDVEQRSSPIFIVDRNYRVEKLTAEKLEGFTLRKGQSNIGMTFDYESLLVLNWSGHKVYVRYGINENQGSNQKEVLLVDRNGHVDPTTPIIWDYDGMDSIEIYRIDERPLTISGGNFITYANAAPRRYTYYDRGIRVRRSNTVLTGIRHEVQREGNTGAPYRGFFYAENCNNVLFENLVMTGHKTYQLLTDTRNSMGTYDTGSGNANNVTWKGCTQTNNISDKTYWGVHASNFCKNLTMRDCVLSRFDAHQGMFNASVINTTLGQYLNCIGGGLLYCENVTRIGSYFIQLRGDYGSTWEGDVQLINCTLSASTTGNCYLFSGSYVAGWDFGYECFLPQNITVEAFRFQNAGSGRLNVFWSVPADAATDPVNPYRMPQTIRFRNMSRLPLAPNESAFSGVQVIVE